MIGGSRGLRVTTAVALGFAASGFGLARAAQAMTFGPGAPSRWVVTDSAAPTAAITDPAGDTPVGSFLAGGSKHVHRAYFTYDLAGLRGQALHTATLSTAETSVHDCGTASPVEIWRTGPTTGATTWANPPAEVELTAAADLGPGARCPGAYLGVDVLAAVEAALARQERTITFEVRVGAGAEGRIRAGRTMRPLRLAVAANHVPVIDRVGPACGTPDRPAPAGAQTSFAVHVTDGDGPRPAAATIAVWPVERPDQRRQFRGGGRVDLSGYPDGTVLAWAAQAHDGDDPSAWSAPCYVTADNTAPRTPPAVSSATCVPGRSAPAEFVLDAGGDPETVAFAWHDDRSGSGGQLSARRPGGRARLSLPTPPSGGGSLEVSAVDAAGNRGPAVSYDLCPRDWPGGDAPGVDSAEFSWDHDAVADRPGTFTFTPNEAGVTAYLYDFGTGRAQRVAAGPNGTATAVWTPPQAGHFTMNVSAMTADGVLSEPARRTFDVLDPRPAVWSDAAPTGVGVPAHVTISSDLAGVRRYLYSVDGGPEHPVPYAYQATVPIVPAHAGRTVVAVRAQLADGTLTPRSTLDLTVSDAPVISPVAVLGAPAVAGRIGSVRLSAGEPGVVGFRYTVNAADGERTVAAGPDGQASVEFAPDRPGWRTLTAVSVRGDGTVSAVRRYPVAVADPQVQVVASWPATGPALGMAMPGTFRLLGDLADQTAEYLWHVDDGPVRVEPRDPAAAYTQIPYTPGKVGPATFSVQRKFRDGSLSPVTDYHFEVGKQPRVTADPPVGAPGRATTLSFGGGMPRVVSFDYQVTGDSDGAVDASGTVLTDSTGAATVAFTPRTADGYQVIVTGHTADGAPTGTTTYRLAAY